MKEQADLFNAAVVGENPEMAFTVLEGDHLHAIEPSIAEQKGGQIDAAKVTSLLRGAFKALSQFAEGKVEAQLLEIDWEGLAERPGEREELISKIRHVFVHLPHHDRNTLSSLIHHRQATVR